MLDLEGDPRAGCCLDCVLCSCCCCCRCCCSLRSSSCSCIASWRLRKRWNFLIRRATHYCYQLRQIQDFLVRLFRAILPRKSFKIDVLGNGISGIPRTNQCVKGALSRYFSVILQCRNMFPHQWKPKNNDAVLLLRTLSLHRNHLLLPIT